MANTVGSSTQAPPPQTQPRPAREPEVSREQTPQRTERAEAPPENAPAEQRRPDPDERRGTRVNTEA